jgi:hypothetical protein
MRTSTMALVFVAMVVLTLGAGFARADLAPPDSCSSPGQPCQTAGAQYDQAGTCVATTCSRLVHAADGGTTPLSYACDLCQVPGGGGGAGNAGNTGNTGSSGGSNGTGAAGSAGKTSGGSSGCAVAGRANANREGAEAALLLVLAGLAAARGRRRTSV